MYFFFFLFALLAAQRWASHLLLAPSGGGAVAARAVILHLQDSACLFGDRNVFPLRCLEKKQTFSWSLKVNWSHEPQNSVSMTLLYCTSLHLTLSSSVSIIYHLSLFGSIKIYQDLLGSIRIFWDPQGSFEIHQDLLGSIRIFQDLSGSFRIHPDPSGSAGVWTFCRHFGCWYEMRRAGRAEINEAALWRPGAEHLARRGPIRRQLANKRFAELTCTSFSLSKWFYCFPHSWSWFSENRRAERRLPSCASCPVTAKCKYSVTLLE